MLRILELLSNLKNPEGHGYQEADNGLKQTDIIMRLEGLKPYTETYPRDTTRQVVPKDEVEALVKSIKEQGNEVGVLDCGDVVRVSAYIGVDEKTPIQLRVASGIMGKHMGRSSAPYNVLGQLQMASLASSYPDEQENPMVCKHFDWAKDNAQGTKEANKLYASYSRSLKLLLDRGYITANIDGSPTPGRYRHARYLLSDSGREYLSKS